MTWEGGVLYDFDLDLEGYSPMYGTRSSAKLYVVRQTRTTGTSVDHHHGRDHVSNAVIAFRQYPYSTLQRYIETGTKTSSRRAFEMRDLRAIGSLSTCRLGN